MSFEEFIRSQPPREMVQLAIKKYKMAVENMTKTKKLFESYNTYCEKLNNEPKLYTNVKFDTDDEDAKRRYTDENGWEDIDDIKCYYCNSRGCDTVYKNGMVCHADCE
jgi:hypothetical protein